MNKYILFIDHMAAYSGLDCYAEMEADTIFKAIGNARELITDEVYLIAIYELVDSKHKIYRRLCNVNHSQAIEEYEHADYIIKSKNGIYKTFGFVLGE